MLDKQRYISIRTSEAHFLRILALSEDDEKAQWPDYAIQGEDTWILGNVNGRSALDRNIVYLAHTHNYASPPSGAHSPFSHV